MGETNAGLLDERLREMDGIEAGLAAEMSGRASETFWRGLGCWPSSCETGARKGGELAKTKQAGGWNESARRCRGKSRASGTGENERANRGEEASALHSGSCR